MSQSRLLGCGIAAESCIAWEVPSLTWGMLLEPALHGMSPRLAVSRLHVPCRGVQQIAEQAFWDVLAEGLEAQHPQWERLLALLEEAGGMLLELIPENAGEGRQLRASVLEKLDMVRTKHGCCDFRVLFTSSACSSLACS